MMKIVKFDNGKYGIRTYWLFGWSFVNFSIPHQTELTGSPYFHQAQTHRYSSALDLYNELTGKSAKHKVIELDE